MSLCGQISEKKSRSSLLRHGTTVLLCICSYTENSKLV
uniref:Uncharacterized protein n=1 Tax=Heterorhabditis bacteriophora TaxID=37862 RepID=A0A1I7WQT6_HETBA